MNVAIIQCDAVADELVAEFGHYTDMIKRMFETVDAGFEYRVFDSQQGEYPHNLDAYDFYITTGSKAAAYQDTPWIKQLINFVKRLDKQQKKLIGICFGHQIIAMARQGQVEKSLKGWGIGLAKNRVVTHPEWMKDPADELNIIISHQDQISRLPDDARVIASNDFCPYFIVQWGNHFLSIQGHPEWLPAYSRALMNHRRKILGDERVKTGLASLAKEPDNTLFTRWILDFVAC
jgi:GMP synthase-like glutamine amidotransferase